VIVEIKEIFYSFNNQINSLGIIIVKVAELFINFVIDMKNLFVVIFVLFSVLAFSQGENKTDAKGQKQGEWKKYHKNGMLRYVGSFKNDKPIGVFKYYYDTGKLQVEMTHLKSKSYAKVHYETGEVKAVGKYVNQKKDSTWVYYDLDGYKRATEHYNKGLKDKVWYVYFPNGQVAEEKEYKNDFENGMWNQYRASGFKKMTATHENGGLEGKAVYYGGNGKRQVSGFYYHGLRTGVWMYFEEDGIKIKKKEEYKNGRRIDKNKDDNLIKPEDDKAIPEDFLQPDNFISPR